MSVRSKYPINGICRFENFREQVENNNFTTISIGRMCDINGWRVSLEIQMEDGTNQIYPFLSCQPQPEFKEIVIRCFLSYLNHDKMINNEDMYCVCMKPDQMTFRSKMKVHELLDEENGWLDNGTLCIEYGFHIEAIQYMDGIWEFNFNDKCVNFDQREDVIEFEIYKCSYGKTLYLYTPRELVNFHSRLFTTRTYPLPERFSEYYWLIIPDVLQIAHGVNKNYSFDRHHLEIAKELEFQNVIRFCERQIIQESLDVNDLYLVYLVQEFQTASNYNLNHYLAHLLKNVGNVKRLTDVLKTMRLKEMSTEFMKQCTKYFFENSKTEFGK